MLVTKAELEASMSSSEWLERSQILAKRGRLSQTIRRAEEKPWGSAQHLADIWRWVMWLTMVRGYRSGTTVTRYLEAISPFGAWVSDRELDYQDVELVELDGFMRHLYAVVKLSATSRCLAVTSLKSFYRWRSSRYGGRACANDLRMPKVPKRMPKAYTAEQLKRLFESARSQTRTPDRIRDEALLLLLYSSGLRREEVCNLRLKDLTIDSVRIATIRVQGKGSKERIITIEGPVVMALARWLQHRRDDLRLQASEYLFCALRTPYGQLVPKALETRVKILAKRAGLREWGVHRFRVTFATQLYDDGVDLERIRIALGHSKIETTRGYLAISNRQRTVRLAPHRQHSVLGTSPIDMPIWAKKLETSA